ncbi:MAG: hypothetical protein V5A79_06590 [Candidatus Bipolaricaulota bacterium]
MRCSPGHVEEVSTSSFWKDVIDFIESEKDRIKSELERTSWNHSTGELDMDFHTRLMHDENLRGAIRALDIAKQAPEYLIAQAEEEAQERENKEEG